jgi:hypothetical protein
LFRSKALKTGRSKEELLKDVVHAVRELVQGQGGKAAEHEQVEVDHSDCFQRTAGLIVLHLCDSAVPTTPKCLGSAPQTSDPKPYRGTSLIRNSNPSRTTIGP